jgi:DNA mismatch repair ATPase MutS
MSQAAVLEHYQATATVHRQHFQALERRRAQVLLALALAIGLILVLTFQAIHSSGSGLPLAAAFAAVGVLVWYSLRVQAAVNALERRLAHNQGCLQRADGTEAYSARTGLEANQNFRQPTHLYERDLDLLGDHSLFSLLNSVRTGPGERGLANYLLDPATHEESLLRQQAVRELTPRSELRERIALLGRTRFQQISASFFDEWLADKPPTFHPAWRYMLGVTSAVNVLMLLLGLLHVWNWSDVLLRLAAVLALQGAICLNLRARVIPLLQGGARLEDNVKLFAEGLAVLQSTEFHSEKLLGLQQQSREPAGAVKTLAKLLSPLAIIEQRPKEYFFLFSLLLAAGTQAAISVANWKHAHAAAMQQWLAAWSEFEALNALAAYAFEHPEDAWPELLPDTQTPTYMARALGHPLLPGSVTNDIALGTEASTTFYLISGSNMAGKSTLLRSIGINAVLAYAGAPVRAASLSLSPLALGAALALTDSLAEGKSKFLAEVERLSAIVLLSRSRPLLFLVDEIFSGTNSADRRTAARAVVNTLLAGNAIGALSTHDLALTELASEANHGLNVHMASPDPDDPLAFDYCLKPGVNTSSNALAIVRLLGLDA